MSWRAWLFTETGRMTLQYTALATGFAVFGAHFGPNTLFIDNYKEFVSSYEKGEMKPVEPKVRQLFDEVVKELKPTKREYNLLDAFTVYGFDVFHAGSTEFRSGAIIGLPVNFTYEKESDVDRKIKVVTKAIDWESEAGEKLRSSLVLSEDARRFAIAREVAAARGFSIWLYSLYPLFTITTTYLLSRHFNNVMNTRQHPFRYIIYLLTSTFGLALYTVLTDLTTCNLEQSWDKAAASINENYAKGGLEFYVKQQERNKALRELMGKDGEKLYTVTGNQVSFIRIETTPLSERIKAMQELIAKMSKK